jgi:IS30 family transposase
MVLPAFKAVPFPLRKTLTHDQRQGNGRHVELAQRLELRVFADPHSLWQRPPTKTPTASSVNICRYRPSKFTQQQLDEIAWSLNNRPRKVLGFARRSVHEINQRIN